MKAVQIISMLILLAAFLISLYLYPTMPDMMASHWDYKGDVNGYMPKLIALFLVPALSAVLYIVFIFIPRMDPLGKNIEKIQGYYDGFIIVFLLFMLYIHILTIIWTLGIRFSMLAAMSPAFGALFIYLGMLLGKIKRNYTIGIRTPWTLADDYVWDRTHSFGGKLFIATGIIAALGLFFPDLGIYFMIIPLFTSAIMTVAFSYIIWRPRHKSQ
jgi:uncharacterized membrane protein